MSEQGIVRVHSDLEELRKAVELARKAKGLSIRHLAALCGVTPNAINKFLNGFVPPGEFVLMQLAHTLDLDTDWCLAKSGRIPAEVKHQLVSDPEWFALLRDLSVRGLSAREVRRILVNDQWI